MKGGIIRLRQKIEGLSDIKVRHLLGTMVSGLTHGEGNNPALVVGPLLAYAWLLEEREHYTLATDVLQTVAAVIDSVDGSMDYELAVTVHRRIGDLFHRNRLFDDAETSYARARVLAEAMNNQALALDARIHLAGLQCTRGNLGDADTALATVIEEASRAQLSRVEAFARRTRGAAIYRRKRPGDALREYYAAFVIAPDDLQREWLLGDIAACVTLLGLRDTARLVHQVLAKTSHSLAVQSLALVNLLEIYVLDDNQVAFHALRKVLQQRDLARDLRLYVLLFEARAAEQWQGVEAAIAAYTVLVEQAQLTGVHDLEFEALEALKLLQRQHEHVAAHLSASTPPPDTEWRDVTEAIEAACRLRLQTVG